VEAIVGTGSRQGDDADMEDIAGYRVLRAAGHGDRAALLVGFADGETAVLKVTPSGDAAAEREIEALARAAGEHVVGLRDVDSDDRRVVLVLDRLDRGSLADLLDRRGSLTAGEAVTVLAPVASTIDRLHRAGVAHGGISPNAVCFAADGSPALVGFGAAELFSPGSPEVVLEAVPGVSSDREALRRLAELVVARVPELSRWTAAEDVPPADLATALFDLATPVPVRFDGDPEDVGAIPRPVVAPASLAPAEPADLLPAWLAALVPEELRHRIDEPLTRIAEVWSTWGARRRRVVLGGVAGAVGLLAFVAVLPPPTPGTGTPVDSPSSMPSVDVAALPEDPAEAAAILLETREGCIRDLSVLCLGDVVQEGSAAAAADAALIRGLQGGEEYPMGVIAAGDPVLVERLGDSALVDMPLGSSPASVLLLRTTNGWRLRQYFEEAGQEAPAVTTSSGQIPSLPAKSPLSRRALTAPRKRAASAPSTMRWSYDRAR